MSAQEPGRVEVGDVFEYQDSKVVIRFRDDARCRWVGIVLEGPDSGMGVHLPDGFLSASARLIRRGGRAWPLQQEQEGEGK